MPSVKKAAPGIFYMVSKLNAKFDNLGMIFDQRGNKSNDTNIQWGLMYKSYRDLNGSEVIIELEVDDVQEPRYEQGLVPNISVFDRNTGDFNLQLVATVDPADIQITYNPDTRSVKYTIIQTMNFRSWTQIKYTMDFPFLNYKSALIDFRIKEKGTEVFSFSRDFKGIHYTPMNDCAETIIA